MLLFPVLKFLGNLSHHSVFFCFTLVRSFQRLCYLVFFLYASAFHLFFDGSLGQDISRLLSHLDHTVTILAPDADALTFAEFFSLLLLAGGLHFIKQLVIHLARIDFLLLVL